jgi:glycosyltransferase involved in cell wall biosynthesis
MNICIFGSSFLPAVGGMEYVIHNLANALVEIGHEVTVISKRVSWEGPQEKRNYKLNRYSLPVKGSGRLGLDYALSILLTSLLCWYRKFDVLSCHGVSTSGTRARVISKLWGLPLVMTPHGEDIQRIADIGYGLRLDPAWDRRITKNLQAADYVTAISQSIHRDLDVVPEERIADIPNGVHIKRFAGPRSNYLHDYLGIPESKKIILSVGRDHVKKGYVYGIQAMSILVNDMGYKNTHYVIVGRGATDNSKSVVENQVSSCVSLIDELPQESITSCYKSADIFLSPSIVEGLSLVGIEAMASGLPLVVTNVPGNDDVVRDNGCGVVVKSQDAEDIARGLYKLLSDDLYRSNLAHLAKQGSFKYDWLQIAKRYEDIYRIAIQERRKQKCAKN